nr:winged helix-turn-helix domain-containing protein [Woeseiaceae bacterium]
MSKAYSDHRVYEFGDFILDVDRASLYRADEEISLRPQAFDVLRYLVDQQGKVVSRDELHDAIWGATVVTDDAVTQCLTDIRRALGDESQAIIRTVPRRGYVFELPVTRPADPADAPDTAAEAARFRKAAYTRLGQGLLAIAVISLLAVWVSTTTERSTEPETEAPVEIESTPTIAVLPFTVRSDDQSQTYFADGVSDEILSLLAHQRGV